LTRLAAFIAGVTLLVPGEHSSSSKNTTVISSISNSKRGSRSPSPRRHTANSETATSSRGSPKRRDHSTDRHRSSGTDSASEASGQLHTALKSAVLAAGLRGK
jgi:hypothetical protein